MSIDWAIYTIALMTGIGIIIGAVSLFMSSRNSGENLLPAIVAITVASIVYACVMLPIFGII